MGIVVYTHIPLRQQTHLKLDPWKVKGSHLWWLVYQERFYHGLKVRRSLFPVISDEELLHKPTKQKGHVFQLGLVRPDWSSSSWPLKSWALQSRPPHKKKILGRNLVIFLENLTDSTQPSFPNSPSLSCQQQKPKPHHITSPEARLNPRHTFLLEQVTYKADDIWFQSALQVSRMLLAPPGTAPWTTSLTARSSCSEFSVCHTNALYVFCSADNCGLSCVFEKFHPTKWQMYKTVPQDLTPFHTTTECSGRMSLSELALNFWANTDRLFLERGNVSPN